jgi:hypothetical protein
MIYYWRAGRPFDFLSTPRLERTADCTPGISVAVRFLGLRVPVLDASQGRGFSSERSCPKGSHAAAGNAICIS